MNRPPAGDATRRALHDLVGRLVICRHGLSAESFIETILERATARAPDRDARAYAETLSLDDLYLATACTKGDDGAWREFKDRYFDYIGTFTRRFLPDVTARDVRDQIIADLWQRQRLARYDGRSTLRTWLGALTAHASINANRMDSRRASLTPAQAGTTPRPGRATTGDAVTAGASHAFVTVVERAIAELDSDRKLLLFLYYEQDLTLDQMTVILGGSKATLSRRLSQLRVDLRTAIDRMTSVELAESSAGLAEGLDFGKLELDLSMALGTPTVQRKGSDGV